MDLYSQQQQSADLGGDILDGSGLGNPSTTIDLDSSTPRGLKRGHTPDLYDHSIPGDVVIDDSDRQPRKRGRPMKGRVSGGVPESPGQINMSNISQSRAPPRTPQQPTTALPTPTTSATPIQSSPPRATPKSVVKALPTVRDHTTDQLGPEGDEYIPREYDESGEKKVSLTGQLHEKREYKCRTFLVPERGNKLFMLATECARVLNYRDSYLLFNKNRSLYKIIASQVEKEDLIRQEILPFSYRSRQIAIVTARSMFRQFGSRVIVGGRRVKDDYWEAKARKQGFTEDDLAGDKRPGAAKAREAASAEAASNNAMLSHPADIIYSNTPGQFGPNVPGGMMLGSTVHGAAMMPPSSDLTDIRATMADYRSVARPRQELTGPAYQDRLHATPSNDMIVQAQQAADFNKQVNQQRLMRGQYMGDVWRKSHDPSPGSGGLLALADEILPVTSQALQSPRTTNTMVPPMIAQTQAQNPLSAQSFQPPHPQTLMNQSPMRSMAQPASRPDQMRHRSPSLSLSSNGGMGQNTGNYGYGQAQMWPPPQPQPTPQHGFPAFNPLGPQVSPQMASASQQVPGMRHAMNNPQMQPPMQPFPGMQGMPQNYSSPGPGGRAMYNNDPSQHQYMQQGNMSGQNWPPNQQSPTGPNPWPWQG